MVQLWCSFDLNFLHKENKYSSNEEKKHRSKGKPKNVLFELPEIKSSLFRNKRFVQCSIVQRIRSSTTIWEKCLRLISEARSHSLVTICDYMWLYGLILAIFFTKKTLNLYLPFLLHFSDFKNQLWLKNSWKKQVMKFFKLPLLFWVEILFFSLMQKEKEYLREKTFQTCNVQFERLCST